MNQPLFLTNIETVNDVKLFFIYLLLQLECEFEPDRPFSTYTDKDGAPMFNEFMAKRLEWQMITCETVCFANNVCFYQIACEVMVDVIYTHEEINNL